MLLITLTKYNLEAFVKTELLATRLATRTIDKTDKRINTALTMATSSSKGPLIVSLPYSWKEKVNVILASQSPRRREILDMMGLVGCYQTIPSPLNETQLQIRLRENGTTEHPKEYTRILAEEKAKALANEGPSSMFDKPTIILGSDTIVDQDDHILEKPNDPMEATVMLNRLSGTRHFVHTGVALYLVKDGNVDLVSSFADTATVSFAHLSEVDIESYVATEEPMDKAGAYGIQGLGGQFVDHLEGDFFTVMGLPMHKTSRALAKAILGAME